MASRKDEQVRSSRPHSGNGLKNNSLPVFSSKTGTEPGQCVTSLYDALRELCKEKKMSYFQPRAYIDYTLPKLTEGKEWYVSYSVRNPSTDKMQRFKIKVNRWKTVREKRQAAKAIIAQISEQLSLGWNPIIEASAPKAYVKIFEALENFLKVKERELEANSMRSYNSYVKSFRNWLVSKRLDASLYVAMFDKRLALEYMESIEKSVSARTYNNYLAFCRDLFNWFKSRGYSSQNPFDEIKKKPKRLTKKIRRTFTDEELSSLFSYLNRENPEYLAMCLLCYCCLLRPKEIALLRCEDIDLNRQIVYVSGEIAKNDKNSVRTIPTAVIPYFERLDLTKKSWFLFGDHPDYDFSPGRETICSRKIAKFWSHYVRPACKFKEDLQFYSLKDTGVTNMIGGGVPISFVQQQADHSSISMTAIYLGKSEARANSELKEVDIIPHSLS